MANFIFKIIPKILADRIADIAARIISPSQHAFIKGRKIQHAIGLTSESFNLLNYKSYGGNVGLKIDISKAFDTLDWNFLIRVLTQFGFNQTFTKWITTLLHSASLSILVNGTPYGFFNCCKGVRQGDPLSPILFCLAQDALSRSISNLQSNGSIIPITSPHGFTSPTHIFYADDIIIFCRGTKRCLKSVVELFDQYGAISGQFMNRNKSKVIIGKYAAPRIASISQSLGMQPINGAFDYLGVPRSS